MQGSTLQSRCSVQVLYMVSIQLAATTIINLQGSSAVNLNETSSNIHQSSLLPKSVSSHITSYANHRMDEDDSATSIKSVLMSSNKNSSLSQTDREAASSMLRPQLALQIYTNPSPQDSFIKSSSMFPRSFGPTMLIVPVQHKLSEDFHLTSSTNQVRHPHQTAKSNHGKINQWRYLTYQGNNLLDGLSPGNGLSEYHSSNGPLINTIITVPTSSDQQSSNHRNHLSSQASLQEDESKTNVEEQSIAKLLDSQLAGNLEFTMNLNGEEITFNPATNKARITRSKAKVDSIGPADDDGNPTIKRSSGKNSKDSNRIVNRALKTHVDSDLIGDQQSASDIDISDSVTEEDEADVEYDRFASAPAKNDERITKQRASDDNEDSEKDEKLAGGSAQNRNWPMDVGEDDQNNKDTDDQGIYESSSENQLTKAKKSKESSRSEKKVISKVTKSSGRKSASNQSVNKKALGSKKKVVHRNSEQNNEDKSDEKDDVPSVMIKSDDVRRFEQLLENLRSISLDAQAAKNRRSGGSKSISSKQKQAPVLDSEDEMKDEELDNGSDTRIESKQDSKSSDNSDTTDCDRKRQQQLQKAASEEDSSSSYDLDSSPNTMDQESANDSDRDNVDTSSQNGEQEEQTRNHSQRVAPPSISSSTSYSDKQQNGKRDSSSGREKPKSVVIRKTVVQSYYNEDGDQEGSRKDNIRLPYNGHEINHEQHLIKPSQPVQRGAQNQDISSSSTFVQRPSNSISYHQNHDQHYADVGQRSYTENYNHQPADRDTVRASESQRVKTVIIPKMLTMRKIRPLQEMIAKTLMKPTSTNKVV